MESKMMVSGKNAGRAGAVLAACAALMLAGSFASATPFLSAKPAARVEYWQKREADIANTLATSKSLRSVRLVFLGDSITDFWSLDEDPWVRGQWHGASVWAESFGGKDPSNLALNLGISGDRTEHILHRIRPKADGGQGELDPPELQPDYVVLLAGINNSWAPEDPAADSIYDGVVALVEAVHARKPHARIVLQSLLPTNNEDKNRDIVRPVNARLSAYAALGSRAGWVRFLDLYPAFVDGAGKQIVSDFNDGLHPSTAGYRVWRDQLVPFLAKDRTRR
jgi:lysophospholipase L1-like esterase